MGNVKKEMRIAESKRCVLLKELKEKKAGKEKGLTLSLCLLRGF